MHPSIDPQTTLQVIFVALGGIAIAAACGLRAFLPLLALGLAARFGIIHLAAQASWLQGTAVLAMLGVATVLEVLADKIPVVDHALDAAATFVRPAAAALAGWASFAGMPPALSYAAAVVLGAGALGIHALKAKTRLGSTALTLGHANPVLSVGEDVTALGLSIMGIVVPVLSAVVVLALVVWALRRGRRRA